METKDTAVIITAVATTTTTTKLKQFQDSRLAILPAVFFCINSLSCEIFLWRDSDILPYEMNGSLRHRLVLLLICAGLFFVPLIANAETPVNIIFDTDVGNDVDDALALAILHAFENRHEAKILAVTITKDNQWAAPYVDLVDTFYGRPEIPVGKVRNGKTPNSDPLIQVPSERKNPDGSYVYPHKITDGSQAQDAVTLLRKTLAAQPDGSVVIVQVGFSTNLARLLDTKADAVSKLDGATLAKQKVRLLVTMSGNFANGDSEFNLNQDVPSAQKVFNEWPTPIVDSGFEIGMSMLFPASRLLRDFAYVKDHPVAEAYRSYKPMPYDRPTWDLTAALYAVRPDDNYFSLSPLGKITVLPDGHSRFDASVGGTHRYLIIDHNQRARTLETLILLASEPPQLHPK
jgi:inosine-uridine nucleoside N-ribohydrolase